MSENYNRQTYRKQDHAKNAFTKGGNKEKNPTFFNNALVIITEGSYQQQKAQIIQSHPTMPLVQLLNNRKVICVPTQHLTLAHNNL